MGSFNDYKSKDNSVYVWEGIPQNHLTPLALIYSPDFMFEDIVW